MPHQLSVSFYVSFFENPVEATAFVKVQGCLQEVKKKKGVFPLSSWNPKT